MTGRSDDDTDQTPTRRQTLLALGGATLGAAGYGYGVASTSDRSSVAGARDGENSVDPPQVETLTAIAAAVYPSEVNVDQTYVEQHVLNRTEPKPGHFDGLLSAIEAVDDYARARFGGRMPDISEGRRRQVLHSMGVTTVHPTPDGTTAERVRYYLINDLLYALFTSPASSALTGIDNPPGYPGGREAYQRGPNE